MMICRRNFFFVNRRRKLFSRVQTNRPVSFFFVENRPVFFGQSEIWFQREVWYSHGLGIGPIAQLMGLFIYPIPINSTVKILLTKKKMTFKIFSGMAFVDQKKTGMAFGALTLSLLLTKKKTLSLLFSFLYNKKPNISGES